MLPEEKHNQTDWNPWGGTAGAIKVDAIKVWVGHNFSDVSVYPPVLQCWV